MKVLVGSAFEAGAQWAHAINTTKMAEAFARLGHDVVVVCRAPAGGAVDGDRLAALYGLRARLRWVQVRPRLLGRTLGKQAPLALQALPTLLRFRPDLVFSRHFAFPFLSSLLGFPTVAESHAHVGTRTGPFLRLAGASRRRAFRLWVTISEQLAAYYHSVGVPRDKLAVLPDAVDLGMFARPDPLPPGPYGARRPVVAYAGHLYDYKGIPTVLEAAERVPEADFHLVGGWPDDVARHQATVAERGLKNVTLHGLVPHAEVAPFLWHADVLLLPPSADHPSAAWTSPVKLGEYLASRTPVVATAIPALRDWLTDAEACFVPSDDPEALAGGIRRVLSDGAYAHGLADAGWCRVQRLSYEHRAGEILDRLQCGDAAP
jgi:glycosyltransferase involved in cell wall biosynthesis